ncbi:MAG: cupredoxin domain-containing protein [Gemmataceae bacterium]
MIRNVLPSPSTVRWTNDAKNAQTVTSAKGDWGSGQLAPGQEFTATFTQPGTFEYTAGQNKDLKGTIVVK